MMPFNTSRLRNPVPESQGGTGATSFSSAIANIFASNPLAIAYGGTNATTNEGATYEILPDLFFQHLLETTVPSFAGWWRADQGITQDLTGSVTASAWEESTGTGLTWEQSTKANQPLVTTVNGRTTLQFDGSNDHFTGDTTLKELTKNRAGLTVITSWQSLLAGTNQDLFYFSTGTSAAAARARYRKTTANVDNMAGVSLDADTFSSRTSTTGPGLNPAVTTCIFNYTGQLATIYRNGALSVSGANFTSNSTSNTDSLSVYLGASNSAANPINGYIWGMMIFTSALTDSERQIAEGVMAHRAGISF